MKIKGFIITFCSFPVILIFSCAKNKHPFQMTEPKKAYTYLALGDSYTIGQSVMASENFPNQTVQLLNQAELQFQITGNPGDNRLDNR
jgi:hypothetical protein